jgi:hypothetical protein
LAQVNLILGQNPQVRKMGWLAEQVEFATPKNAKLKEYSYLLHLGNTRWNNFLASSGGHR